MSSEPPNPLSCCVCFGTCLAQKLYKGSSKLLSMLLSDTHDMVIPMHSMITVRDGTYPTNLLTINTPSCNHCAYFGFGEVEEKLSPVLG